MNRVDQTGLIWLNAQLLGVIDQDRHRGVTIEEIHDQLRTRSLFRWLESELGLTVREYRQRAFSRPLLTALSKAARRARRYPVRYVNINGVCFLATLMLDIIATELRDAETFPTPEEPSATATPESPRHGERRRRDRASA